MQPTDSTQDRILLQDLKPPVPGELIVVVGPTASGKTDLAIAIAERFGGEVIGADSVQIYKYFDLGSGKPSPEERARVPHHVVDLVEPNEPIDAAQFAQLADQAIEQVWARNRVAVVCGGTYLWVKALLSGLTGGAPKSDEIRAKHKAIADAQGRGALHSMLAEVDPASAQRLHPNDFVRVSRALEVLELTGETLSKAQANHGFATVRYPHRLVGVFREREALEERIVRRTGQWLNEGWVDEVRSLIARGYGDSRAMGSVGYQQIKDFLAGQLPENDLHPAIIRATRVLVRRQRTWLRDEPVQWVVPPG